MGVSNYIVLLLTRPLEFRTLLQYKLYHESKRDITATQEHETSGWDRQTMRKCWSLLEDTSRSFAAVIKELEGDLARTICLFYLVLRGLDTIEDDKTLDPQLKQNVLRSFHKHTITPGWTFTQCGPNEKDRHLLEQYDNVVTELMNIPAAYRETILDITYKMQTGMADYCLVAERAADTIYLETIEEYDLYCHYVAGLVGEGLSRLFSASGKEADYLKHQIEISNSMGILLQKTNIIRDYNEDTHDNRFFWPREIWGSYGFKEMKEMMLPENAQRAQWVQSHMVLDALRHCVDSLDYLRLLRNQSVFNFCAIPSAMAIATLELCFMNPAMFQRNIKIRKAEAADLIMKSTNPRDVAYIFRDHARKIHAKIDASDPSFLKISVMCGKIEQWCEHLYPSFVGISGSAGNLAQTFNPEDRRTEILILEGKQMEEVKNKMRIQKIRAGAYKDKPVQQHETNTMELVLYMGAAFAFIVVVCAATVYGVLKFSEYHDNKNAHISL